MESYPTVKITCQRDINTVKAIFEAMAYSDVQGARDAIKLLDSDLVSVFDKLVNEFGEYLESIEDINCSKETVTVHFMCNGPSADYLASLLYLFGPYADKISGILWDEKVYGDKKVKFMYNKQKVCLNKKEYSSRLFPTIFEDDEKM